MPTLSSAFVEYDFLHHSQLDSSQSSHRVFDLLPTIQFALVSRLQFSVCQLQVYEKVRLALLNIQRLVAAFQLLELDTEVSEGSRLRLTC